MNLSTTDIFNSERAEKIRNNLDGILSGLKSTETKPEVKTETEKEDLKQYQADFDKVTVQYDDLDLMLNLTGDILLSNRSLLQQAKQNSKSNTLDNLVWATNKKLLALQNKIIEIRSLPFSTLTKRYARLVFDLSNNSQTPVDLVVNNEDTLVDRTILEKIHEPMIHLIRNVFAHAVDSKEERRAKGKPEHLTLTISCVDGSGSSTIEISDDGKGISVQKVKDRANTLGLYIPENASDKEILSVIFKPEFSATENANELSGRGIGLYVVQKTIQDLGGRIDIHTAVGVGTTFRMNIPNVFMLRDVLLFQHSGLVYGITRDKLKKIHTFNYQEIHHIHGKKLVNYDDVMIEILDLAETDLIGKDERYFIELKAENADACGIAATKILGYQEVIVKSIDHLWGGQKNIAGVAQIDTGELSLIIDVYQLASEGLKSEDQSQKKS